MDELSFNSYRSAVLGRGGMAAASQPLAVAAGLEVLAKGGNAADAAVAVAAGLNLTEPASTGLGGDCFALYFDAASRQVTGLNGSGRAPRALTLERIQREGFSDRLPSFHPYTVTVPGACAGWFDLIERHGRLPMSSILAPVIRMAEEGFPVAPLTALSWRHSAHEQLASAVNGIEMTLNGRGPQAGEIFRNPGLARSLQRIAEGGKAAFYQGEIAEAIVAVLKEAGGCMSMEDLADHTSTWVEPISTTYRGLRIFEIPPNGQGITALIALNILEGFDLADTPRLSAQRLHLEIEAMRLAFADSRYYVADPALTAVPVEALLSKDYAAERRKLINLRRANPAVQVGLPNAGHDTVYFCTVDADGNACSFINSNYYGFGSGIVPRGYGFVLQNRGLGFSLDASMPNVVAPGKRPYHTIIPGMAVYADSGALYAPFGVMGGFMQPQGHTQVIIAMLDDGLDPQQALNQPRFCVDGEFQNGPVLLEEGVSFQTLADLANMGHAVRPVSGHGRGVFGRGQIIRRDPQTGVLWGGSDPRSDGCVMGLIK